MSEKYWNRRVQRLRTRKHYECLTLLVLMVCTNVSNSLEVYNVTSDNKAGKGYRFPTSKLPGPRTKCPIAFHAIGSSCYFYGYFDLNWFRAAEFCHSFGESVSLAVLETEEENQRLKVWLSANADRDSGVWIGGSENGHHRKWAWFPTGMLIEYTNWGASQPSGGDQHCLYLVGGLLGYQWADFQCEFEMRFLCEHKVNRNKPWSR